MEEIYEITTSYLYQIDFESHNIGDELTYFINGKSIIEYGVDRDGEEVYTDHKTGKRLQFTFELDRFLK